MLETAMTMEALSGAFYEALALASDDAKVRQFCSQAWRAEAGHLETFRHLYENWKANHEVTRLPEEMVEQLRQMVKTAVLPTPAEVQEVATGGNLREAIKLATEMEAEAVHYYQRIAQNMPSLADAVRPILAEENRHLAFLRTQGRPI